MAKGRQLTSCWPQWKCVKCSTPVTDPKKPCVGDDGKCRGRKFVRWKDYEVREV